jgi:hypothetical protein
MNDLVLVKETGLGKYKRKKTINTNNMAEHLFYFLVFPGLLFAGVVGGLLSWFDRKVTAWVQFRRGPVLMQPFYDFLKLLLVKETIVPARGSVLTFLSAPVHGTVWCINLGRIDTSAGIRHNQRFQGRYHSDILPAYHPFPVICYRGTGIGKSPGGGRCITGD